MTALGSIRTQPTRNRTTSCPIRCGASPHRGIWSSLPTSPAMGARTRPRRPIFPPRDRRRRRPPRALSRSGSLLPILRLRTAFPILMLIWAIRRRAIPSCASRRARSGLRRRPTPQRRRYRRHRCRSGRSAGEPRVARAHGPARHCAAGQRPTGTAIDDTARQPRARATAATAGGRNRDAPAAAAGLDPQARSERHRFFAAGAPHLAAGRVAMERS